MKKKASIPQGINRKPETKKMSHKPMAMPQIKVVVIEKTIQPKVKYW